MENFQLLIVTGMSGAGKSRALQSLEDMGYFCIDNLPPILIPKFSELCCSGEKISNVAMVVDIRGGEFFESLNEALQVLAEKNINYEIIFMEASDKSLIIRYKETRRSHPLAPNERITEGVKKERELLQNIRNKSDYIIDTSTMKTNELKELLKKRFGDKNSGNRINVNLVSFGFKYGLPLDADMVWDVRFLPNPYYLSEMRHKTGRMPEVAEYINKQEITQEFKTKYFDVVNFLLPQYEKEGKSQFVIAIGCTGGMHRSVCMTEELGKYLREVGYHVIVEHRDMLKNNVEEDYEPQVDIEQSGG